MLKHFQKKTILFLQGFPFVKERNENEVSSSGVVAGISFIRNSGGKTTSNHIVFTEFRWNRLSLEMKELWMKFWSLAFSLVIRSSQKCTLFLIEIILKLLEITFDVWSWLLQHHDWLQSLITKNFFSKFRLSKELMEVLVSRDEMVSTSFSLGFHRARCCGVCFFFCGIETETKTPNDWLTTRALPGFTGFSASRRASATCSALFNWRRCQTWLGLFRVVEFVPWRWPRTDTRKPSAWPGFSLSMSFFFLFTLPSSFGSRPLFLCFFVGGNEET